MKKYFYISIAIGLSLTSCSPETVDVDPDMPVSSAGAYVLTQGSYYNNVDGSLSLIDYATNSVQNNVFSRANGRSLGATPQCGAVYGGKIYLGMKDSHTIEVLSRKDYKSVKQIRLTDASKGVEPQSMVVRDGFVYVAMFDGYVARLDTLDLEIRDAVKVGPNPETIAIYDDHIYVPNSDGMNWQNGYGTTATAIEIPQFIVRSTFEVPLNPRRFIACGGKLFLLCAGDYGKVGGGLYEIENDKVKKRICDASEAAGNGNMIYIIHTPWTEDGQLHVSSKKYFVPNGSLTDWDAPGLVYPSGIAADPVRGEVIVTSYKLDGVYPAYSAPTMALRYDYDGSLIKKYDVGVGPACIFFDYEYSK